MKRSNTFKGWLCIAAATTLLPFSAKAQYFWDAGIRTGGSNYLGDMGGQSLSRRDFVSDMKMSQTHLNAGAFVRYKVTPKISVKTDLNWIRISGDDKLSSNPGRNGRNLSFRNDMFEMTAQAQYFFYEVTDLGHTYRYRNNFRAYVGLGAGAVYHDPKTMYNCEWVKLRPLETEGRHYTTVTAVIPASAGFYVTLNKRYRIGWDITWRTTFTDYLDDVSTTYKSPSALPSSLSAEVANRSDELKLSPAFAENFTPGNKRGDPTHNDSYITTSVDMSYVIRGHSAGSKPMYPWISDRQNHPSKYGGPKRNPHSILVRKHRYHW